VRKSSLVEGPVPAWEFQASMSVALTSTYQPTAVEEEYFDLRTESPRRKDWLKCHSGRKNPLRLSRWFPFTN